MQVTCHPRLGVPDLREGGGHRNFSLPYSFFEHLHKNLIIQKIQLRIYISIFVNHKH